MRELDAHKNVCGQKQNECLDSLVHLFVNYSLRSKYYLQNNTGKNLSKRYLIYRKQFPFQPCDLGPGLILPVPLFLIHDPGWDRVEEEGTKLLMKLD